MSLTSSTESPTTMPGVAIAMRHFWGIRRRLIIVIFVDGGRRMRGVVRVSAPALLLVGNKLWLVLCVEEFFQQAAVSGSAFDGSVDQVADEGNSPNQTVGQDPSLHLGLGLGVQSAVYFAAHGVDVNGQDDVERIADFWNGANDGGPAEAHSEEAHLDVQAIGPFPNLGQDFGIMGGNVVRDLFAMLLHAALLVGTVLEVGIPSTAGGAMRVFGQLLIEEVLCGHAGAFLGEDLTDLASHFGEFGM